MNNGWPEKVVERLQAYADRTEVQLGEAANKFKEFLNKEFAVTEPMDEDEYYLVEWAEMFVIETRNLGTSQGSRRETKTYVGLFVGLDDNIADLRKNQRERAVTLFRNNSEKAINDKVIGIVSAKEGMWHINGEPTQEKVDGSNLPWFGLEVDDRIIALLNQNENNKGKPIAPSSKVRNLYIIGNDANSFQNEIKTFRIQLTGDLMTQEYEIGRPVKCQVIEPNKTDFDTVYTNRDFSKTMEYNNDFVNDEDKNMLRPERFLVNDTMHDVFCDLSELVETYDQKKLPNYNGTGHYGPLIVTRALVSRLNREPSDSEWDQTGRSFRMNVTSLALQSKYDKHSDQSEITVWVPGRVHDDTHPFEYKDEYGEWKPYAERTPVIIFGRLKLRPYKDDMVPSITAFGVYVPPRTARPGAVGGDTSLDQFGGN